MPSRVLVIPDLHCPHQASDAYGFLASVKSWLRPDLVVCVGDELDAASLSRYKPDPDAPSAGPELARGREALRECFKLFPKVLVCKSNHTWRIYKKAFDAGLPECTLRPIGEILDAPKGWQWADSWTVDGVDYIHGDGYSGAKAALEAATKRRRSTVMGHVHAFAGVQYSTGPHDRIWGMNVGCLIDPTARVFRYAENSPNRPTLGCGYVEDGVPCFLPM